MNIKLIVFDLDGTLIEWENSWNRIRESLGLTKEYVNAYINKEITYFELKEKDKKHWIEKEVKKEGLKEALKDYKLNSHVEFVINELKKRNIKIVMISEAPCLIANEVGERLGFDYVFCTEIIFNDENKFKDYKLNVPGPLGKLKVFKEICKKLGIDTKNAIAVGDHLNDIEMLKEAGISIAYNSKVKELDEIADVKIEDMRELLRHID
ncbi:MAG: HAD family hydrolase [Candidatus Hydrothermarchaeota archaeon]